MNKKAEIGLGILIILLVIGLVSFPVLKQLFTVYTPNIQPTGGSLIINKEYYDTAVSNYNYPCQTSNFVIFRTSNTAYGTITSSGSTLVFTPSGYIGYTSNQGTALTSYVYSSSGTSSLTGKCSSMSGYSLVLSNLPYAGYTGLGPGWRTTIDLYKNSLSGLLRICGDTGTQTLWYTYSTGGSINTSPIPADSSTEILYPSSVPIRDAGTYACKNNNVYLQYCSDYDSSSQLLDTCDLGCSYLANQQVPEGIKNLVKCNGNFKPNQKSCSTDGVTLYQTNANGALISPTTCGYICYNSACVQCKDGTGRCASSTQPQTCVSSTWQNSASCTGISQCVQTGTSPNTASSCQSGFSNGDERCNGNQPQIFQTAYQNWVNNGTSCGTQCQLTNNKASCVNQCSSGNTCNSGIIYGCNLNASGNILNLVGNCWSGLCTGNTCTPKYTLSKTYCSGNNILTGTPDTTSTQILSGGVMTSLTSTCLVGCDASSGTAKCVELPLCTGKEGKSICSIDGRNPDSVHISTCSSQGDSVGSLADCTVQLNNPRASCSSSSGTAICTVPASECSGNFACKDNTAIYSCVNGFFGTQLDSCNSLGCNGTSQTLAQCNDNCQGVNVCSGSSSYKCEEKSVQDYDGKQKVKTTATSCGLAGCDPSNGLCKTQCSGTQQCVNGGIYSCNNGVLGNIIDSCNGAGCSTSANVCNNQCTNINTYSCDVANTKSSYCFRNSTANNNQGQNQIQTINCGLKGCDITNGKCYSGIPNSYTCVLTEIHPTDINGQALSLIKDNCDKPAFNGTLLPYCSEGFGQCKLCEQDQLRCGINEIFQCANPFTGEKKNVHVCSAGCNNLVCDNLLIIASPTQYFFSSDNVVLSGTIKGDTSGNPLSGIKYQAILSGPGANITQPGVTDVYGGFHAGFGKNPLGDYTITIVFPQYPIGLNLKTVQTRVTDSYKIKLSGTGTALQLPGKTSKVEIEAIDAKGNVPDSLTISSINNNTVLSNVTATIISTGVAGKFELQLSGQPGMYDVGLKSVLGGTTLDEQKVTVELRKPQLSAKVTAPSSATPGKKQFDINVQGPLDELTSGLLVPESVKVTVSHSPAQTVVDCTGNTCVTGTNLGGGKYSFSYDFSDIGTYTITSTATKNGYEDSLSSQALEISNSGTSAPPVQATSGNETTPPITPPQPGGLSTTEIIMGLIIIGGIVYFGFIRK